MIGRRTELDSIDRLIDQFVCSLIHHLSVNKVKIIILFFLFLCNLLFGRR